MLGEHGSIFPVKRKVLANEDSQADRHESRNDLSWLFLRPIANRHPSKPELRSITPNIFMPSDETAYSSRTTPIWRKLSASISFSTTAICGMVLWVAVPAGVATWASSSRVSFEPYEHSVMVGAGVVTGLVITGWSCSIRFVSCIVSPPKMEIGRAARQRA